MQRDGESQASQTTRRKRAAIRRRLRRKLSELELAQLSGHCRELAFELVGLCQDSSFFPAKENRILLITAELHEALFIANFELETTNLVREQLFACLTIEHFKYFPFNVQRALITAAETYATTQSHLAKIFPDVYDCIPITKEDKINLQNKLSGLKVRICRNNLSKYISLPLEYRFDLLIEAVKSFPDERNEIDNVFDWARQIRAVNVEYFFQQINSRLSSAWYKRVSLLKILMHFASQHRSYFERLLNYVGEAIKNQSFGTNWHFDFAVIEALTYIIQESDDEYVIARAIEGNKPYEIGLKYYLDSWVKKKDETLQRKFPVYESLYRLRYRELFQEQIEEMISEEKAKAENVFLQNSFTYLEEHYPRPDAEVGHQSIPLMQLEHDLLSSRTIVLMPNPRVERLFQAKRAPEWEKVQLSARAQEQHNQIIKFREQSLVHQSALKSMGANILFTNGEYPFMCPLRGDHFLCESLRVEVDGEAEPIFLNQNEALDFLVESNYPGTSKKILAITPDNSKSERVIASLFDATRILENRQTFTEITAHAEPTFDSRLKNLYEETQSQDPILCEAIRDYCQATPGLDGDIFLDQAPQLSASSADTERFLADYTNTINSVRRCLGLISDQYIPPEQKPTEADLLRRSARAREELTDRIINYRQVPEEAEEAERAERAEEAVRAYYALFVELKTALEEMTLQGEVINLLKATEELLQQTEFLKLEQIDILEELFVREREIEYLLRAINLSQREELHEKHGELKIKAENFLIESLSNFAAIDTQLAEIEQQQIEVELNELFSQINLLTKDLANTNMLIAVNRAIEWWYQLAEKIHRGHAELHSRIRRKINKLEAQKDNLLSQTELTTLTTLPTPPTQDERELLHYDLISSGSEITNIVKNIFEHILAYGEIKTANYALVEITEAFPLKTNATPIRILLLIDDASKRARWEEAIKTFTTLWAFSNATRENPITIDPIQVVNLAESSARLLPGSLVNVITTTDLAIIEELHQQAESFARKSFYCNLEAEKSREIETARDREEDAGPSEADSPEDSETEAHEETSPVNVSVAEMYATQLIISAIPQDPFTNDFINNHPQEIQKNLFTILSAIYIYANSKEKITATTPEEIIQILISRNILAERFGEKLLSLWPSICEIQITESLANEINQLILIPLQEYFRIIFLEQEVLTLQITHITNLDPAITASQLWLANSDANDIDQALQTKRLLMLISTLIDRQALPREYLIFYTKAPTEVGRRYLNLVTEKQFPQEQEATKSCLIREFKLYPLDSSGSRIADLEEKEVWENSLAALATRDKFSDAIEIIIEIPEIARGHLEPNAARTMFTEAGELIPNYINNGNHMVHPIEIGTNKFHIKFYPEYPLQEYAIYRLNRYLAGYGIAEVDIAKITVTKTHRRRQEVIEYPVIISRTIEGEDFLTYSKRMESEQDNWQERLDQRNYTKMVLQALLTNPEDAKLDNFIASETNISRDGAANELRIVGVDNDHAFLESITLQPSEEDRSKFEIKIKTKVMYYCFDVAETMRLDREAIEEFIRLDPDIIIPRWLREIERKNAQVKNMFSDRAIMRFKRMKFPNCSHLEIEMHAGIYQNVYQRFHTLQDYLQTQIEFERIPTALDLVSRIDPLLAKLYAKVHVDGLTLEEKFYQATHESYGLSESGRAITLSTYDLAVQRTLKTEIGGREGIPISEAIERLEEISTNHKQFLRAKNHLLFTLNRKAPREEDLQDFITCFQGLKLNPDKQALINELDFEYMPESTQSALLRSITNLSNREKPDWTRLRLRHCKVLTDDVLINITSGSPKLMALDLSYCENLTGQFSYRLSIQCQCLERLYLRGLSLPNFGEVPFFSLQGAVTFNELKHLDIIDTEGLDSHFRNAFSNLKKIYLGLTPNSSRSPLRPHILENYFHQKKLENQPYPELKFTSPGHPFYAVEIIQRLSFIDSAKLLTPEETLSYCNQLLVQFPDNEIFLEKKTKCIFKLEKYDEASLNHFECVLRHAPNQKKALVGKAKCFLALERYGEEALEVYTAAFDVDPGLRDFLIGKAKCLLALERYDEEALGAYTSAFDVDPGLRDFLIEKVNCLLALERYDEEALGVYTWAFDVDSGQHDFLIGKAKCLLALERYDEKSLHVYEKALRSDPNQESVFIGPLIKSIQTSNTYYYNFFSTFQLGLSYEPENLDFLLGGAKCLRHGAKTVFSSDLEGTIFFDRKRYRSDRKRYRKETSEYLANIDDSRHNPNQAEILLIKALIFEGLSETDNALRLYEQTLSTSPNQLDALTGKTRCLLKQEKYDEASLNHFECVLRHAPNQKKALVGKARCFLVFEKFDEESLKHFNRVLTYIPHQDDAFLGKEICLAKEMHSELEEETLLSLDERPEEVEQGIMAIIDDAISLDITGPYRRPYHVRMTTVKWFRPDLLSSAEEHTIMLNMMNSLLKRRERLEILADRSRSLELTSRVFHRRTRRLYRRSSCSVM